MCLWFTGDGVSVKKTKELIGNFVKKWDQPDVIIISSRVSIPLAVAFSIHFNEYVHLPNQEGSGGIAVKKPV